MMDNLLSCRWNEEAQTPHGGQDWRELHNFVEDFSVTTNPLGAPSDALSAAKKAIEEAVHYPPSDFEPAWSALALYLHNKTDPETKQKLLLGNGASEFIDLAIRMAADIRESLGETPSDLWRPGPFETQYMEYSRAAEAQKRRKTAWNDSKADLICIVNPCNPSGEYKSLQELKSFIEANATLRGTTVIIDESMLPFKGIGWQSDSFARQSQWCEEMADKKEIFVFVIHSWTKYFACPGLRIGSLVAPNKETALRLRRLQVPWSLNGPAVAFLHAAVTDIKYMERSFESIVLWRCSIVEAISREWPSWVLGGISWQPFIWIDTKNETLAYQLVSQCKSEGVPIRWGQHGYLKPSCVRIAVREPSSVKVLLDAITSKNKLVL